MDGRDLVRSVKMVGSCRGMRRGCARPAARRRADARALAARGAERARVPGPRDRCGAAGRAAVSSGSPVRSCGSVSRRVRCSGAGTVRNRSRRTRWPGAATGAGSAGTAGAGQGRRLAGGLGAGDGRRVPARRGGVAYAGRCGAAPGAAAALVGAGGWRPGALGAAVGGRRGRPLLRAGRPGRRAEAAGRVRTGCGTPTRGVVSGPGDDPLYSRCRCTGGGSDAGTHLAFHDNSWDGPGDAARGRGGRGLGTRPAGHVRGADGGRSAALLGGRGHARQGAAGLDGLTGAPALPPSWALGPQHARWGFGSEQEVRRIVAGYRERGLPLSALHLDIDHYDAHQVFTVDRERFPDLPRLGEGAARGRRTAGLDRRSGGAGVGRATRCTTAVAAAEGAFVRDAAGPSGAGRGVAGRVRLSGLHRSAGARVVGRAVRGAARPGVRRGVARHERAGVVPGLRGSVPAAFGAALAGGPGRRPPGGPQRVRPGDGAGPGTRRCAGWPGRAAVPVLPRRAGRGMQRYGGTWSGDVATGWPGLRASLALVLGLGLCGVPYSGPDVGGFDGSPVARAVSALVPAGRVHAVVPYPCGHRRGAPGAVGVRAGGPRARRAGAGGAGAAAPVLRDAGPAGAADGCAVCAAAVVGRPGGPGAAGLRGRVPAG